MKPFLMSLGRSFLEDVPGYLTLVITVALVVVVVIWKAGARSNEWKSWKKLIEDWKEIIPTMQKDISKLTGKVESILSLVRGSVFVERKSPAKLTEFGAKIAKAISAEEIVIEHIEKLKKLIPSDKIENDYDLEQACLSINSDRFIELLNPEQLDIAKAECLQHGIVLAGAVSTFPVFLRNEITKDRDLARQARA